MTGDPRDTELRSSTDTVAVGSASAGQAGEESPAFHQGWQPISTAPRDGTRILLSWPPIREAKKTWGNVRIGKWRDGKWALDTAGHFRLDPDMWMPLPRRPECHGMSNREKNEIEITEFHSGPNIPTDTIKRWREQGYLIFSTVRGRCGHVLDVQDGDVRIKFLSGVVGTTNFSDGISVQAFLEGDSKYIVIVDASSQPHDTTDTATSAA